MQNMQHIAKTNKAKYPQIMPTYVHVAAAELATVRQPALSLRSKLGTAPCSAPVNAPLPKTHLDIGREQGDRHAYSDGTHDRYR